MKSSVVFSGESSGARAATLAADVRRLGRPRSLEEIAAQIDAVTLDRVNDYLARRSMGRSTIQTLGPAELRPPTA
jgi:predicted Zn-dependent peptidase